MTLFVSNNHHISQATYIWITNNINRQNNIKFLFYHNPKVLNIPTKLSSADWLLMFFVFIS